MHYSRSLDERRGIILLDCVSCNLLPRNEAPHHALHLHHRGLQHNNNITGYSGPEQQLRLAS